MQKKNLIKHTSAATKKNSSVTCLILQATTARPTAGKI